MNVLVACESSGTVRDAFIARGHNAWSCDLLPTDRPGPHYQCDIREIIVGNGGQFDLLIAHPPCTYLCNSGVRWLHTDPTRWEKMREASEFFRLFDQYDGIPLRAIENPIMHGYALELVGRRASQFVQPWMFGHPEIKATGLWLTGLPLLKPENIVAGREPRIHRMPPGPERWKERSKTFQGIADAMANQWGNLF